MNNNNNNFIIDNFFFRRRMLMTLLKADGVNTNMITVYIDGYYEEPFCITKLFGVNGIQNFPTARGKARISHNLKVSLSASFKSFPKAKNVIVLQDDIDVSVDIFKYVLAAVAAAKKMKPIFRLSEK